MRESIEDIASENSRYSAAAVRFVYEGLDYTIKKLAAKPGHVSGRMLCEGLKRLALEKWGRLAVLVLNTWGVRTSRDFGEIVFLMIRHEWMSAQPTDTIEDFDDLYDFETVFKKQFKF
jgi:uncharacterized repeat protein (TIGR04138 family)